MFKPCKFFDVTAILLVFTLLLCLAGCADSSAPMEDVPAESLPSSQSSVDMVEEEPSTITAVDVKSIGLVGAIEENKALLPKASDDTSPTIIEGSQASPEAFSDLLRVCILNSDFSGYMVHYYNRSVGDSMMQLAQTTLGHFFKTDKGINIGSAKAEKGFAIIDIALEEGSEAAGVLADKTMVEALLNSLYTTFASNNFYLCGFTLNGRQFDLGGVTLPDDGYGHYENAPVLFNQPISAEEFAAIRAALPYPYPTGLPKQTAPYEKDDINHIEEYSRIYSLLYYTGDLGEYSSPEELDESDKIAAGLKLSPDTYNCSTQPELYPLYPADTYFLEPLVASVNDFQFTPEEWVEEAVKQLWGPNTSVSHQSLGDNYYYHPKEGVYTPPHRGGGVNVTPYIHSIEKDEGQYIAEVSYVTQSMPGTFDPTTEEWLPTYDFDSSVIDLAENRLPRYRVTVSCSDNMTMYLQSCTLAE